MTWAGVMPAITTPFTPDGRIDHGFLGEHARWMVDHGCSGIVALGSLGEGATLGFDERGAVLRTLHAAVGARVPVVAAISALSTAEAVRLVGDARTAGCAGVMLLPPYVHQGPWGEVRAHFDAMAEAATGMSCMVYNNPIAYGTDLTPAHIEELAGRHEHIAAVKESSGDVRRLTAVRERLGDRLALFAGLDDMVVEAAAIGAAGWIAGLVNALPAESVALFEAARDGDRARAWELYSWFLPLLRLDTAPEFVQLIKLVQERVGRGSERVRAPRRPVGGGLREQALAAIDAALETRPQL